MSLEIVFCVGIIIFCVGVIVGMELYKREVLSRPISHSSAPAPETCAYPEGCRSPVDCPETRKAQQEERERLLDEAIEKLWHMPIYPEEKPKERIQEMLESLRECGYSDEVLVAEIPLWRDARARGGWQR